MVDILKIAINNPELVRYRQFHQRPYIPGVHISTHTIIDTQSVAPRDSVQNRFKKLQKRTRRSIFRSKKRAVRYGLVVTNVLVVIGLGYFVVSNRPATQDTTGSRLLATTEKEEISDPLDTISSADIAVNIAQLTRMDETVAVTNNADSINAQVNIVPTDSQIIAKPQIVSTDTKSVKDIQTYVAVAGDSVDAIAARFGVTADSVKWSNDLSGNAVAVGKELTIPPVDGFVYTVKDGDTTEKIAEKFSAEANKITAFNDTEISGIVAGQKIVIPGGRVPTPVVARYSATASSVSGFRYGNAPIYGYNGYDYGYCTWYAANRRAEAGRPVPANLGNASTWKVRSQMAGYGVGTTPQPGAVIWTPPRDYYGHVGYVEEVYEDGSVRVSEMNVRGWNVRSEKTLSAAQAAGYWYIY